MSRQRGRGTRFESGLVRWWTRRTGDHVWRPAPGGAHDQGDVHGIVAHGCRGIAECKDYADWCRADLRRWQAETAAECSNADADFALLVVHRSGCDASGRSESFGRNHCFLRLCDLPRVHLGLAGRMWPGTDVDEVSRMTWVDVDLADVADMVTAERDEVV